MTSQPSIIVGMDNNVPVIEGTCPTCKRGKRSLILTNYIPKEQHGESEIYMQCLACFSKYKTMVKYVCD